MTSELSFSFSLSVYLSRYDILLMLVLFSFPSLTRKARIYEFYLGLYDVRSALMDFLDWLRSTLSPLSPLGVEDEDDSGRCEKMPLMFYTMVSLNFSYYLVREVFFISSLVCYSFCFLIS